MPHSFHRDDATFTQVDYADLSGTAPSQTTISDKNILSNISGSTAAASGHTLSDILDNIIGSSQGTLLYRGSSAWAALAPGTDGQYLKSHGADADPIWADNQQTVALLDTKTASNSATLDFTSGIDSTYVTYQFLLESIVPVTNQVQLQMQYSVDAGANWIATNYNAGATVNGTTLPLSGPTDAVNTANLGISGEVMLFNPASSSIFKLYRSTTNAAGVVGGGNAGYYTGSTAAVNGIRFKFSSGNISTGTIRMYGIRGS